MSLAQLKEMPRKNLTLLIGPPGAGKSTFCHEVIANELAMERPVILVTTDQGPNQVLDLLRERGVEEIPPGALSFVDAYGDTVGLASEGRSDTVQANCEDLNSISMAITKLQQKIGGRDILLAFDSLTSPYLFNEKEVLRFIRIGLLRSASEGNSVLAVMDEGCGKVEDLGAMMSIANGIIKMEVEDGSRALKVVKHPRVKPTRIEVQTDETWERKVLDFELIDREKMERVIKAMQSGAPVRKEVGNYVNIFWPNFAKWSNIVWDPMRFQEMIYDFWVDYTGCAREVLTLYPWYMRLIFRLSVPGSLSRVKDMKKMIKFLDQEFVKRRRYGVIEYLEDVSKTDEHLFRIHDHRECCGFEDVGAAMATDLPPILAGMCKGLEREEREWNAVETKCVGLGDPYCEVKVVPGEIDELKSSLEKDISVVERIQERLIERIMGLLLGEQPLVERPRLGSGFFMGGEMNSLPMIRERNRMAFRMGGARAGKQLGERLTQAGVEGDEAVKCLVRLLEHCKVGKVRVDEAVRISENCESYWTTVYSEKWEEPCCFFTTGLLNGFFSAVKDRHVRETKCIAMGNSYCEWEFW